MATGIPYRSQNTDVCSTVNEEHNLRGKPSQSFHLKDRVTKNPFTIRKATEETMSVKQTVTMIIVTYACEGGWAKSGTMPGGGAASGMSAGETPDCKTSSTVMLEAILKGEN